MRGPVTIAYRHIPQSEALSEYIRSQVEWLAEHGHPITSCHVVVEPERHAPELRHRCHVRVQVHVPGTTVVAERHASPEGGNMDPYHAVREAFLHLERQLTGREERLEHTRARGARL